MPRVQKSVQLADQTNRLCDAYQARTGCPFTTQVEAALLFFHLRDAFGTEQTAWLRSAFDVRKGGVPVFDAAIAVAETAYRAADERAQRAYRERDRLKKMPQPEAVPDSDGVYTVTPLEHAQQEALAAMHESEQAFQRLHGLKELKKRTLGEIEGLAQNWMQRDAVLITPREELREYLDVPDAPSDDQAT